MNGREAHKIDCGSYYVDFDEDTNAWCVFGSESGFAYANFVDKEDAQTFLTNMG